MSKNNIKNKVVTALELPKEIAFNLPLITLIGNNEILLENYIGLIEYTCEKVRLKTSCGILCIEGKNLTLCEITAVNVEIKGTITKLGFI